jgi:trk system potassium uptake protein TrkH
VSEVINKHPHNLLQGLSDLSLGHQSVASPNGDPTVKGPALVVGYLGTMTILVGCIILLPLIMILFYPQDAGYAHCFIVPGLSAMVVGYLMTLRLKGQRRARLEKHQDTAIILFAWLIAVAICSLPFLMTGKLNITQAVFETTSGLSTTGLTVINPDVCPHIFLFYRSVLLFFGGVGLVLIMVSALSDSQGMRLYQAEGHTDRLLPNLARSARLILSIYSGYIIAGTLALVIAGMPLFDSLNHATAALSTGGFSVRSGSIGSYNSVAIEAVIIVLMILGSTNFMVVVLLLRGRFKTFLKHTETRSYAICLISMTVATAAVMLGEGTYSTIPDSLRVSVFQVVSAMSGTGFQTVDSFTVMPSSVLFLLTICMLLGGQTGSTSGAIKQVRVAVTMHSLVWSIRDRFGHRRNVHTYKVNRFGKADVLSSSEQHDMLMYVVLYLTVFLIGSFIFMLFGYSSQDSMFEFSSALGAVGLSVGITGVDANPVIMWTAIVGMFVGRLEIYPVFFGIWRIVKDVSERR